MATEKLNFNKTKSEKIDANVSSNDLKNGAERQINRINNPQYRIYETKRKLKQQESVVLTEITIKPYGLKRPSRTKRNKGPLIVDID